MIMVHKQRFLLRPELFYSMFRPARFKKFSVIVHQEDLDKIISAMYEIPLAEIRNVNFAERGLEQFSASEKAKSLAYGITQARRTLNILLQFEKKKGQLDEIKKLFSGNKAQESKNVFEVKELLDRISALHRDAENIDNKLKEIRDNAAQIKQELQLLESIKALDLDLELLQGFERFELIIGRAPKELASAIEALLKEEKAVILSQVDAEQTLYIISTERKRSEELLRKLKKLGFERIIVPERKGHIAKLVDECKSALKDLEKESAKYQAQGMALLEKNRAFLEEAIESLEAEKEKQDVLLSFGRTQKTANFDAFVPAKAEERFFDLLEKNTNGCFYAEELTFDEDEAPIKIEHSGYVKPYYILLKTYALPKYNAFDPTVLIALIFPIFFGLAFADVGYGLLLFGLSIGLLKTIAKKSESYWAFSKILLHGSIFGIIVGLLTGSFFGDLFSAYIKPFTIIEPLSTTSGNNAIINFMIFVICLGIAHLDLGLALGSFEDIKRKRYKAVLTDKMPLFLIQASVFLLLFIHSQLGLYAALALMLVSIALLFIGSGPFGIMKITGLLGNSLSYVRLMALGLATSAIAMTINLIAKILLAVPYVGIVIMVLFMIFGHLANFIFNIISSFMHPMRLHYVEFFSCFFEGDGKEFKPFCKKRKTEV